MQGYKEFPYRLCLAGGWMDQQFVNKHAKGSVVTVQIADDKVFNERSGLATSTRNAWKRLGNSQAAVEDI